MLKTIALIGLTAALALPSAPAFAVNGNSSVLRHRRLWPDRSDTVADALPALLESRQ